MALKRSFIRTTAVFLAIIQLFALTACSPKVQKTKYNAYYFDYFDTATTITGYTETEEEFNAVCEEVKLLLNEYHRLFNIYTRYEGLNNLVTINDVKIGPNLIFKQKTRSTRPGS